MKLTNFFENVGSCGHMEHHNELCPGSLQLVQRVPVSHSLVNSVLVLTLKV